MGGFLNDVRERLRLRLKGLRRPIDALPQARWLKVTRQPYTGNLLKHG